MHRDHLFDLLDAYTPFDQDESHMVVRLEHFMHAQPRCFERALTLGHVTGSAWIIDLEREYALLTHHRKLDRWLQLGGHADGEGDILAVALREAREESGLALIEPISTAIFDVDIHPIPATSREPAHEHFDVRFLFQANRHTPLVVSSESKDLAWVPITEVVNYSDDTSMRRMVFKTPRPRARAPDTAPLRRS